MVIDFSNPTLTYKRLQGGGFGVPVAKACGVKQSFKPVLIDATAGLGEDGFLLASLGCHVHMIERHPEVSKSLREGLKQGLENPEISGIIQNISLYEGSALEWIPKIASQYKIDVIYLDPMFPHRQKSALVKKDMRDLRELVGDDVDSDLLLPLALKYAKRIVVKRPKGAPFLNQQVTKNQILGQRGRFDIYLGLLSD